MLLDWLILFLRFWGDLSFFGGFGGGFLLFFFFTLCSAEFKDNKEMRCESISPIN